MRSCRVLPSSRLAVAVMALSGRRTRPATSQPSPIETTAMRASGDAGLSQELPEGGRLELAPDRLGLAPDGRDRLRGRGGGHELVSRRRRPRPA